MRLDHLLSKEIFLNGDQENDSRFARCAGFDIRSRSVNCCESSWVDYDLVSYLDFVLSEILL